LGLGIRQPLIGAELPLIFSIIRIYSGIMVINGQKARFARNLPENEDGPTAINSAVLECECLDMNQIRKQMDVYTRTDHV
jgi:hypothetical protein